MWYYWLILSSEHCYWSCNYMNPAILSEQFLQVLVPSTYSLTKLFRDSGSGAPQSLVRNVVYDYDVNVF